MIFYERRVLYKTKTTFLCLLLVLLLVLPNFLWQLNEGFPLFTHVQTLTTDHFSENSMSGYLLDQVILFSTFATSLVGIWFCTKQRNYQWIAISTAIAFIIFLLFKSKSYYVFSIYPVLFAAGSVQLEAWLRNRKAIWSILLTASIILPFAPFLPEVASILPIEKHIAYLEIEPVDEVYPLTGDFADMHGWPEQVALVDSIYKSLSQDDQAKTTIWAENYGEAGALLILGAELDLPTPISTHGSFWFWGSSNPNTEIWITVGIERDWAHARFSSVTLVRHIKHPYAIHEEQNIPVYLCKNPRQNFHIYWQGLRAYVFN